MNVNELIINKIQEEIPSHIKLVNYLMNELSIGKESAYRRIRNQIPFSVDEIIKLSNNLGFSIDEIFGLNKEKRVYIDIKGSTFQNPVDTFINLLTTYREYVKVLQKSEGAEAITATNQVQFFLIMDSEYLFKFFYYKWIHQIHEVTPNLKLSEITIPDEVISLKNEIRYGLRQLKGINAIYIWDQNIFFNTVKEIRYYYKRKLISENELNLIRDDFNKVINDLEELARKGTDDANNRFYFYLSILNLESNCAHYSKGNISQVYFSLYSILPMHIEDPNVCFMVKRWLDSLKKYSTLITQCNEFVQVKFFNKQREYLNEIENYSFFKFFEE